jgi:LiaI-LiaF-like transmembrane region
MTLPDPTQPGAAGADPGATAPPAPPPASIASPAGGPPAADASQTPAAGDQPSVAPPGWPPSTPWPERHDVRPAGLVVGIVLIVVGALFLALNLGNFELGPDSWPLWLIVPGLAMLAGSLFIPSRGGLGLAVPGAVIAIVGLILWVQSAYDLYATWAYAWALVAPVGPGVAMLAYGAVHRDGDLVRDGAGATVTGLGLFVGLGIFFEGVVGISGHRIEHLDQVLPYAAIGLGLLLIVLAAFDGGRHAARERRRAERAARRAAR